MREPIHKWTVFRSVLFFILLCAVASGADPQRESSAERNTQLRMIQNSVSEATRLMRQDPRLALDMLRALNEKYPGQELIMVRLGQLYQAVGESDSARVMLQQVLEKNGRHMEAGKSLIMIHYSAGDIDRAEALSDRLLKENQYAMAAYRMVGSALMELGRYDEALELFRSGRDRSEDHYRLTLQIADLQRTLGDLPGALSEYLDYVERLPQNYKIAKKQIVDLFGEIDVDTSLAGTPQPSRDSAIGLLQQTEIRAQNSQKTGRELYDILSGVYLALDLLEKSLEAALEADHHQMEDGETLLLLGADLRSRYMMVQQGDKLRYFDLTLRAFEAYIERHPRSIHIPRTEFQRAAMLADAGSGFIPGIAGAEQDTFFDRAVRELDEIARKYNGSEEAALATLRKGDMFFEVRRRPAEALEIYQAGLRSAAGSRPAYVQRIGMMHIVLEEYDQALAHFQRYIRTNNDALREAGIYYTGVIFGFTRRYDAARDTLTALARENPGSPYTNDAIELAWIIEEGRKKDETLLGVYLESIKAELAHDTAGVIGNLQELVRQGPGAALHSRALFRLGEVYAQKGDFDQAMDYLQRFLSEYPTDDLRPDVHRAIARVYEYGYGDVKLALEEYKHILLMYPGYIFLDEVRKDIGRLQREGTYN